MELKILGSSSKGNCYILDNGKEALVIECGISFNEVQKAVNFDISRIKGNMATTPNTLKTSFKPVFPCICPPEHCTRLSRSLEALICRRL